MEFYPGQVITTLRQYDSLVQWCGPLSSADRQTVECSNTVQPGLQHWVAQVRAESSSLATFLAFLSFIVSWCRQHRCWRKWCFLLSLTTDQTVRPATVLPRPAGSRTSPPASHCSPSYRPAWSPPPSVCWGALLPQNRMLDIKCIYFDVSTVLATKYKITKLSQSYSSNTSSDILSRFLILHCKTLRL